MESVHVLFVFLSFIASLVSAVFGFGTALLVLAVGSHILSVKETIALATVLFTTSTITKSLLFGKHIDWKVAGTMAIASLPFAFIGASLMIYLPTDVLRRSLGIMILLYVVATHVSYSSRIRIGTKGLLVGSALYGFVSGLLGSGNLIKVIIFKEMKMSKEAFVGAMAATSVLSNLAKLTAYTKAGLLGGTLAIPITALIAASVTAAFLGRKILQSLNVAQFETGIRVILVVSGIGLLF